MATCNHCGDQFTPSSSGGKYCSLQCVGKSRRKRVALVCAHCGEDFEARPSADRKYCSEPCYRKGRRDRVTNTCGECGESFTVPKSSADQRYCSRDCAAESGRIELTCDNCGDHFTVQKSNSDQQYCSKSCARSQATYLPTDCAHCGRTTKILASQVEQSDTHYCSDACRNGETEIHDCAQCGDDVRVWPSHQHLNHHFCNQECLSDFRKTNTLSADRAPKQEVPCAECGALVAKHESRLERYENVFCSRECANEYRRNGDYYDCEQCGEAVYRHPSAVGDTVFCSPDCFAAWNVGENHAQWSQIAVQCWWCGDDVLKKKNRVERTHRHFCDMDCLGRWYSWANVHPQDREPDKDVPRWAWDEYTHTASPPPDVTALFDRFG